MSSTDYSAVTEVIPQISFDIIGRIIPGITVIVILIIAFAGPNQALILLDNAIIHPETTLRGWAIVLFLILAYVLAIILEGIWQIPECISHLRKEPYEPNLEHPERSLKIDIVNQKLPKAGAWFTKVDAEMYLTKVLITGWFIGLVINLYMLVTEFSLERLWVEVALIVVIIGAVSAWCSISRTSEKRLMNLLVLLQKGHTLANKQNRDV
jgi:hypothetical protein